MNRENAIKCLIDIEQIMITRQEICPREELQYWIELQEGVADALALLNEQEAVEPEKEHSGSGITWWNVCGNCKTAINPNDKYCHECGRAVKW